MTGKHKATKVAAHPIVVGTGLVALDAVVSADESVPVRYWAGGTCCNVLMALSYLGWSARPVARLALDDAADLLLQDVRRWRVSEQFIRLEDDGSTPIIVQRITKSPDGRVRHSFSWRCTVCGARHPSYKPELLSTAEIIAPKLKKVSVFFFDRVSAAALLLAKTAAETGALVVFEPSGIGNPVLFRQAWEIAHVVKYSHERLEEFPELDEENSPLLVIETLGDAGLRYRWRKPKTKFGSWIESKAIPVDTIKDTAGSGDWCTAGLLSRLATEGFKGFCSASAVTIAEGIRYGQALAAWNCRYEGARGGMYAVTRRQFQIQIGEIVSGATSVIRVAKESANGATRPNVVCRACEHSSSSTRRKRAR